MASIADLFACLVLQAGALLGKMKRRCVTGSGHSVALSLTTELSDTAPELVCVQPCFQL